MLMNRDAVIEELETIMRNSSRPSHYMDLTESVLKYMKEDAPVEAEEHDMYDADTGKYMGVHKFCGHCYRSLNSDKNFCIHCGKKVKTV